MAHNFKKAKLEAIVEEYFEDADLLKLSREQSQQ